MKSLEVLQIPVEKRILVIPLDLQSEVFVAKLLNVINLMRRRLTFHSIDDFPDYELKLLPTQVGQ